MHGAAAHMPTFEVTVGLPSRSPPIQDPHFTGVALSGSSLPMTHRRQEQMPYFMWVPKRPTVRAASTRKHANHWLTHEVSDDLALACCSRMTYTKQLCLNMQLHCLGAAYQCAS
jgi:hypothetical protein